LSVVTEYVGGRPTSRVKKGLSNVRNREKQEGNENKVALQWFKGGGRSKQKKDKLPQEGAEVHETGVNIFESTRGIK